MSRLSSRRLRAIPEGGSHSHETATAWSRRANEPALAAGPAYLPTVRLTLKPFLRFLSLAFGFCLITRPLFASLECFLVTVPTRQCRLVIRVRAWASLRWSTFGTT